MEKLATCLGPALSLFLASCAGVGQDATHEGDHAANFQRIFGTEVPSDVEVLNSVVFEYARGGTDDWEFEIVASEDWIREQIDEFGLTPALTASWLDHAARRQENAARPWFAPDAFESYDVYILTATSIPYVQAFVDNTDEAVGHARLYMSKH